MNQIKASASIGLIIGAVVAVAVGVGYFAFLKPASIESPKIEDISVSCQKDGGCILLDSSLDYTRCLPGTCGKEIDYSQENYIAVSYSSFQDFLKLRGPKGPCPVLACLPKMINDNYEARCLNSICKKVEKKISEPPPVVPPPAAVTPPQVSPPPAGKTTPPPPPAKGLNQGVFGTVSLHISGCGQPPPDGRSCGGTSVESAGKRQMVAADANKKDQYGNIDITNPAAAFYTDDNGGYRIYLKPGKYIICLLPTGNAFQICSPSAYPVVTVEPAKFVENNIALKIYRP